MKQFPVVILPGWLLGASRFEPLKQELNKHGFKTFVVDFPGFAEGEQITRAWNLSDHVDYVRNFLKKHQLKKVIFIGHSFGGRVALKLLSQQPTLAHALILTGTPGYRSVHTSKLFVLAVVSKIGAAIVMLPPLSLFEDVLRKLFHLVIGARDLSQVKGYMKQTFINVVEEEVVTYMQLLDVPTLLLWGENDSLVDVSIARKMQKTIRNSQLVTITDANHNALYRQPNKFAQEVVRYLQTIQ